MTIVIKDDTLITEVTSEINFETCPYQLGPFSVRDSTDRWSSNAFFYFFLLFPPSLISPLLVFSSRFSFLFHAFLLFFPSLFP